jgi:hypothetical protein
VRGFRNGGKIKDPLNELQGKEFFQAPIIVKNHEIMRDISPETWKTLEGVDYNDVFSTLDWKSESSVYSWAKDDFVKQARRVVGDSRMTVNDTMAVFDGLFSIFDRFRNLMKESELRTMIIKGKVVVANVLVDGNRKPHVLIPFVI